MTKDKAMTMWSDEVPTKADAGDTYYFVRRKDILDVVIMGFSMGKGCSTESLTTRQRCAITCFLDQSPRTCSQR